MAAARKPVTKPNDDAAASARDVQRIDERIHSFPPISSPDAEILILGSMPGGASLAAGRYYAHPRNSFWRILTEILHVDGEATYDERVHALIAARIAVWDVLQSCHRSGSLDTSIDSATQVTNDFASFFRSHPRIRAVLFNGTKAYQTFRRNVDIDVVGPQLAYTRLPSTSPANASWSFARKLDAWRAALGGQGIDPAL